MLDKFCDIWERWHLNDMRPWCVHQRQLGWDEEAKETITLYHYRRIKGVDATQEANLAYFLDTYEPLSPELSEYYEPYSPLVPRGGRTTEQEMRGWVRYEKSPLGILCKPCPVCGYKYGSSWMREDVPDDVIEWLFSLPDSRKRPTWI
jgi:hypothetical protein